MAFALEHAVKQGKKRVLYVIPYTSIIDQTAEVFESILGAENVLAHYSGADFQMNERTDMTPLNYRRALAAENWDAPVIVTTAVQFFESLFANRSSRCRKLHNLAESVIIFDEAQTLPVDYLEPCIAAISQLVRHYGTSSVLCTATQPALGGFFQKYAPEYPLREICTAPQELYRVLKRTCLQELGTITEEELAQRLSQAQQVLCVVNRRKTAQTLFEALPEEGSFCLTTLLYPADRRSKLKEIRQRLSQGLVCRVVSTSLIEAGVDVDFPAAYREEAGLDSILQTAGRCNREGKRPIQDSIVSIFKLEGQQPLTMLAQNLGAFSLVRRKYPQALDSPEATQAYFQYLYDLKGRPALDSKGILNAFTNTLNASVMPFAQVAELFRLIESPTKTVYIPLADGESLCRRLQSGEVSKALFRELGAYAVSVYPQHFDALSSNGALELIDQNTAILINPDCYRSQTGLQQKVEGGTAPLHGRPLCSVACQ